MSVSWRTRVTTNVEYLVARNSYADSFNKAWAMAFNRWAEMNGRSVESASGDWCQVDCDDEHIIIRVTKSEVTS